MASESFHSLHANVYDRMASGATISVGIQAINDLPKMKAPITKDSYILDNSCGTGLVTAYIKNTFPFAKIHGADVAPGAIDVYRQRIEEAKWDGVTAEIADCRDLNKLDDGAFSHVITNFGFAPNSDEDAGRNKATIEMYRVLKPGGIAVVTTWAKRNFDDALEAACRRIRPNAELYSWKSDKTKDHDKGWWLMKYLEEGGFGHQVEVRCVKGTVSAGSLEELVGNMMLFKVMFWKDFNEEEAKILPAVLAEEIKKLTMFREMDGRVEIETAAWIGFARK